MNIKYGHAVSRKLKADHDERASPTWGAGLLGTTVTARTSQGARPTDREKGV